MTIIYLFLFKYNIPVFFLQIDIFVKLVYRLSVTYFSELYNVVMPLLNPN